MSFWDKHILRKRPDGSRRPGLVVAIAAGVLFFLVLTWTFRGSLGARKSETPPPTTAEVEKRVNVDGFADAAAEMGRHDIVPPDKSSNPTSDRGVENEPNQQTETKPPNPDAAGSTVSAFDSMNAAIHQNQTSGGASAVSADGRPSLDEGGSIIPKREGNMLPATYRNAGAGNSQAVVRVDINKLVWSAKSESAPTQKSGAPATSGAVKRRTPQVFLPRGTRVDVFLLNTIETGDLASFVEMFVSRPKRFDGNLVIPFGTILIGAASKDATRDRIQITVTALRLTSGPLKGREFPLAGIAEGQDGSTGVRGYYIPAPTLVQMAPLFADFTREYLSWYDQRYSMPQVQVGGVGVQLQPGAGEEAKFQALSATSSAIRDYATAQVAELQKRYQAHVTIPEGEAFTVQLTSVFDADPMQSGALVTEPQTVELALPVRPEGISAFPFNQSAGTQTLSAQAIRDLKANIDQLNQPISSSSDATLNAAAPSTSVSNADAAEYFGTSK